MKMSAHSLNFDSKMASVADENCAPRASSERPPRVLSGPCRNTRRRAQVQHDREKFPKIHDNKIRNENRYFENAKMPSPGAIGVARRQERQNMAVEPVNKIPVESGHSLRNMTVFF